MIGECSVPLQDNIDWWVSNPVSRNTLNSDLFLAYCKVQLIKVLLESGNKINEIVVDTLAMKTILHQLPGINDTKITIAKSIIVSSLNNASPISVYPLRDKSSISISIILFFALNR